MRASRRFFSGYPAKMGQILSRIYGTNVWIWLIILIGFGLRAYQLGYRPLWDDEAFSVLIIASDIRQVALATVRDTFPPLYYYVLSSTMILLGWSEFAIRYASLLGNVLAIPVIYQLGRRLINRDTGLWAALVAAFSPFLVYFAQEARAYSWMVLTSLLSVYTFVRIISLLSSQKRPGFIQWAAFSCASAAMLYTHFLSLWILVVEGLYFLWFWWKERKGFRAWVGAHIGIGILFLPWILLLLGVGIGEEGKSYAGTHQLGGVKTDAPIASLLWIWQEGRATRGALTLTDTLRQALISFTVGDYIPPAWEFRLALGLAFIGILGLISLSFRTREKQSAKKSNRLSTFPYPILFLLLYALLPVLLSYFVAFPTSRPHWAKYFMMALPAYVLIVGIGLAELRKRHNLLAALGTVLVIGASLFSLYNYFENPAYARADIRPGVEYLEGFSSPEDALLANPPASSPPFWYYYDGDLPHYLPDEMDVPALEAIATKHAGLWVVQNLPVGFDPEENIERWLTYHTYRTYTDWVGQLIFRYYSMPAATGMAIREAYETPVQFGDRVTLQGYSLDVQTAGRAQIVQIELAWKAEDAIDEEYMVGVRAVDPEGNVWGQSNSAPLGNFRPTVGWQPEEIVLDHLGLTLWPGSPPGPYEIEIWMYQESTSQPLPVFDERDQGDGKALKLTTVEIESPQYPPTQSMLGLTASLNRQFDNLGLLGYQTNKTQIQPGEELDLILFWQAIQSNLPAYTATLWLEDTQGKRWNETDTPITPHYPSNRWEAGQVIRDPRAFIVAADIPDGTYFVKGKIAGGTNLAGHSIALMPLIVSSRDKQFDVPPIDHPQRANLSQQIEFLGYDLPSKHVSAGETLELTLYWRALAPMDTAYTVFNHLMGADNQMAGQWDSPPVHGVIPTTEWIVGEIIQDEYRIPVREDAEPGTYHLFVGVYNPETLQRLQVIGESDRIMGDSIKLDTTVTIR